jgi:hypothetical protein
VNLQKRMQQRIILLQKSQRAMVSPCFYDWLYNWLMPAVTLLSKDA